MRKTTPAATLESDFAGLPPLLTRREAAAALRIHLATLDRMIRRGELRSVGLSPRKVLVSRAALVELVRSRSA